MILPDSASRSPQGHLTVGGCDTVALAERFGTPLYVYDEQTLRRCLREYRAAVRAHPGGGDVLYSAKAFVTGAMVRILVEEDCGIDVVSGGELAVALRFGMPAARIAFAGNNKSADEVAQAIDSGIGRLVIDSATELDLLERRSPGTGRLGALVRVSPGVQPPTHDFISTGQLDSKFGFGVEGGDALAALGRAAGLPGLELRGVHMHIGSQILELDAHPAAIEVVAELCRQAAERLDLRTRELSVGGGLGIAHTEAERAPGIPKFMKIVSETVAAAFGRRGLAAPALLVEPGRSVAGPAGVALYRVGARKVIAGVRTYVALDGGMGDNIRPKLYGARYQPLLASAPDAPAAETVTLAGRYCESTDILVADAALPRLERGDVVALPAAGAYALAMASNYNVTMRPAVVFVAGGAARLVRRRETLDDWLAPELDAPTPAG